MSATLCLTLPGLAEEGIKKPRGRNPACLSNVLMYALVRVRLLGTLPELGIYKRYMLI